MSLIASTQFTRQNLTPVAAPRTSLRNLARNANAWVVNRLSAGLHTVFGDLPGSTFGILMYHRVSEDVDGVESPTWNVTPAQFRTQLAGLKSLGFKAVPLQKLIEAYRESRVLPPNVFAVTFDDGYENNYAHAWPILRELNIPATIFVATEFLDSDQPFHFDDWSMCGAPCVPPVSWRPLSTAQCREMIAEGLIDLGAHTHSHQRFVGRCGEFEHDLQLCLNVLRDRFEIMQPAFALPFGASSPELINTARQAGVACCLSTSAGRVVQGSDPFHWGRLHVAANDSAAVLAAKLSGWHSATSAASQAIRRPLAALVRSTRSLRPRSYSLAEDKITA